MLATNTKAVVGKRHSVASRFLEKNPNVFISGCPCHLAHIATSNVNDAFSKCIGLNVEDVLWIAITGLTKAQNGKGSCWNILTFVTRNIMLFIKSFCALVVIRKMCSKSLEKIYSSYYFYLQKFQFATPT